MRSSVLFTAASTLLAAAAFAQPANDNCSSPQPITGFGQTSFDSTGANTDGPSTSCTNAQAFNDIWFVWTSDFTGDVLLDTCTTTQFDTVLTVYDGPGCPSGNEIACNDDTCVNRSKARFSAVSGNQYLIRIAGYFANSLGAGVLSINQAPPIGTIAGPIVNEANGHTYYLLESGSWTAAEARAVEMGGHLATIRNIDEHSFVFFNVMQFDGPNFRRGWIGLNDFGRAEGDYVWTSGEPVDFTYWGSGEPNHANGTEFYAQIPWFAAGAWNDNSDLPGDDATYGIVEIIPNNPPACPGDLAPPAASPARTVSWTTTTSSPSSATSSTTTPTPTSAPPAACPAATARTTTTTSSPSSTCSSPAAAREQGLRRQSSSDIS
ncbi:MAG: lectin-like protein [Phycisphaerales bacterium]